MIVLGRRFLLLRCWLPSWSTSFYGCRTIGRIELMGVVYGMSSILILRCRCSVFLFSDLFVSEHSIFIVPSGMMFGGSCNCAWPSSLSLNGTFTALSVSFLEVLFSPC